MECLQCGNKYYANNDDEGTYKESFCSEGCEADYERELAGEEAK